MGDRQFYIDDDTGRGHFVEDWPDSTDRDCDECHKTMSLDDGVEWPDSGPIYCWGCAHDKLNDQGRILADLSMLVSRLCSGNDSKKATQAKEYLTRKGLQGSPLR